MCTKDPQNTAELHVVIRLVRWDLVMENGHCFITALLPARPGEFALQGVCQNHGENGAELARRDQTSNAISSILNIHALIFHLVPVSIRNLHLETASPVKG